MTIQSIPLQDERPPFAGGKLLGHAWLCHYQWSSGILQEHRQSSRRIGRVQGHVGSPGFQDTESSNGQFDGPLHAESNRNVGSNPEGAQAMGELIRAGVQLPISDVTISGYERDGIRRRTRLQLPEFAYT